MYKENKIKIDEMKQNIVKEHTKVINTFMKDREPLNKKKISLKISKIT